MNKVSKTQTIQIYKTCCLNFAANNVGVTMSLTPAYQPFLFQKLKPR